MAKTYVHRVTVTGVFAFPIDMLRYDRLCPDSEQDSGYITACMELRHRRKKTVPPEGITLVHVGEKSWTPTAGRWQSFGWKILTHNVSIY